MKNYVDQDRIKAWGDSDPIELFKEIAPMIVGELQAISLATQLIKIDPALKDHKLSYLSENVPDATVVDKANYILGLTDSARGLLETLAAYIYMYERRNSDNPPSKE